MLSVRGHRRSIEVVGRRTALPQASSVLYEDPVGDPAQEFARTFPVCAQTVVDSVNRDEPRLPVSGFGEDPLERRCTGTCIHGHMAAVPVLRASAPAYDLAASFSRSGTS